jgi:glutaminase
LSRVDPERLAIATAEGEYYAVGDDQALLALESLSKPFVYGLALEDWGRKAMMEKGNQDLCPV